MTVDAGVRPARSADVASLGRMQAVAWRTTYAGVLPDAVLAELSPEALAEGWRAAVGQPPTDRHRVLLAHGDGLAAGFTATAPAADPDLDAKSCAELLVLVVDPAHRAHGHGSRLAAAATDLMREDGFSTAVVWVLRDGDGPLRAFLTETGWAADGATRELEQPDGSTLQQIRLHTGL